jgi:signal transduction histidine kinase
MSTCIEALIIYILCAFLYPVGQADALHLMLAALIFALCCFELAASKKAWQIGIGIFIALLCLMTPELSVFLPTVFYILFYEGRYLLPIPACIPFVLYLYQSQNYTDLLVLPLTGFAFYLAYQNRRRKHLQQTIMELRDSSVEKELLLRRQNEQLMDSQNDRIQIATLSERNRIAREIHDNVGHMLSRSILQTGALLAICKDDNVTPHLQALKETLDEAMNNIRTSVHDLHDEAVDLEQAITQLTEQFSFCPVELHCDISRHIPKDIKYSVLSITREALNNIIKHSHATLVTITLKEHPGFYQLKIEDNGAGCDADSLQHSGIGLTNMEERVRALHGILHINRSDGFRIFITIPKEANNE